MEERQLFYQLNALPSDLTYADEAFMGRAMFGRPVPGWYVTRNKYVCLEPRGQGRYEKHLYHGGRSCERCGAERPDPYETRRAVNEVRRILGGAR